MQFLVESFRHVPEPTVLTGPTTQYVDDLGFRFRYHQLIVEFRQRSDWMAGIFIIVEQSPGTSRNICGFLSVFIYGHLLNFEATPAWDCQDRTGTTFVIKCSSHLYRVIRFDQPAAAYDSRAVNFVRAVSGRVLDNNPKIHNDQWIVHASLVIPSFCNEVD